MDGNREKSPECNQIEEVMRKWKTSLEVRNGKKLLRSQWIDINGDAYSLVGFCCTEMLVMLLEESDGYKMGSLGKKQIKRTHSLFIDDLKTYEQNHQKLKMTYEILPQKSMNTGAIYGVKKCAEIVFTNSRIIKGEGSQILQERIKALYPNENECIQVPEM